MLKGIGASALATTLHLESLPTAVAVGAKSPLTDATDYPGFAFAADLSSSNDQPARLARTQSASADIHAGQLEVPSSLRYTNAVGYFPRRGSAAGFLRSANTLAFESSMNVVTDGTTGDRAGNVHGIFMYRFDSDSVVYSGIEHGQIRGVSDRWVLFIIAETYLGEDYNGDGIIDETPIPGVVNVETGDVTYLRVPRLRRFWYDNAWIRLSDDRIVMRLEERQEVAVYDLLEGSLVYTPVVGSHPVLDGDILAYSGGASTLHFYNLRSGETVDTGAPLHGGESPTDVELTISGNWITFYTYEPAIGRDLNGDGVMSDVLGVCNVMDGQVRYLPYDTASMYVAGNTAYLTTATVGEGDQAPTFRLGAYDLLVNTTRFVDLPVPAVVLAVGAERVALGVYERLVRDDLNDDGYISGAMVAAFLEVAI
jgi:hypothetical protein